MRKFLCAVMILCVMASGAYAAVEISKANFPDDTFRYAVWYEYHYDDDGSFNGDEILTDEEIAGVTEISLARVKVNGVGMYSMKGIEYFTELVSLDCSDNMLTELDLSKNKKLISVECNDNHTLRNLNVSGCENLVYLNCNTNSLTELDVSGCPKLEELVCYINYLEKLDVSKNTALRELICWTNNLTELDVSKNTNLEYLDCDMNYITSLNAEGCTWLNFLRAARNSITSLNVNGCNNLWEIDIANSQLSELNLSGHTELWNLRCENNRLVSLDLSGCAKLFNLNCSDNMTRSLILTNCTGLLDINCNNNQLESLDVSTCAKLETLRCRNNRLTGLNLSNNYNLIQLRCANNYITRLDLSNNRKLFDIQLHYNHIPEIDLSKNTLLGIGYVPEERVVKTPYATVTTTYASGDVKTDNQVLKNLELTVQPGNEYPYMLDLYGYVSTENVKNIIASSVQGLDEENVAIETTYSNGTAQFKALPARVRYAYATGLEDISLDVTIGGSELLSLALDGHVYRAFNHATSWTNARAYCQNLGGDLAVITTDTEKKLAEELIRKALFAGDNSSEGYWLGAQLASNDVWSWINGESFTEKITEVHSGGTSSSEISQGSEEDGTYQLIRVIKWDSPEGVYLQISNEGKFVGWHDLHLSGFICEWDSVEADKAAYSEEYRRYIENPAAYLSEGDFYGDIPEAVDFSHLSSNPPQVDYADEAPSAYDPRSLGLFRQSRIRAATEHAGASHR